MGALQSHLLRRWILYLKTGNNQFDSLFFINAKDENLLKKYFDSEITSQIMAFIKSDPKVYSVKGKVSFTDERIIYKEGPYFDIPFYKEDYTFENIFKQMTELSKKIYK